MTEMARGGAAGIREAMPSRASPGLALIVDDDDAFRASLAALLRQFGVEVAEAGSLAEARRVLASRPPDFVLLDLELPDGRGLELKLHADLPSDTPFAVVSGDGSARAMQAARREGASDYLVKPIDPVQLKAVLHALREGSTLRRELRTLRTSLWDAGRFGRLFGRSPRMREVYDRIARVAPTAVPVLLTGESGTGKELAAATIHEMSPRRAHPFVAINCGAIPQSLIESSLFGHERGAFTGAEARAPGVFEQADGGTLFLDEIGEMPMDLQVRLLRVLESRTLRRIGGDADIEIDVRVVAATNRDARRAVEDGVLREDLFHRLNVFPIRLPALRERPGDVRLLALAFLEALNEEGGIPKRLAPEALEAMERLPWPGNVRELKNALQRAWILADETIGPAQVSGDEAAEAPPAAPRAAAPPEVGGEAATADAVRIPVGTSLAEAERLLILATLKACQGNKRKTARTLGMSVKTLYSRLAEYE